MLTERRISINTEPKPESKNVKVETNHKLTFKDLEIYLSHEDLKELKSKIDYILNDWKMPNWFPFPNPIIDDYRGGSWSAPLITRTATF